MSPAGGGAQELGVPLGAVAGRVGGSLQAVGLDGGCSPWGLAWERLVERPAWGCGAEGMALCPACNGACSAAGRAARKNRNIPVSGWVWGLGGAM